MPMGALANALRRSAGGSASAVSVTCHLRAAHPAPTGPRPAASRPGVSRDVPRGTRRRGRMARDRARRTPVNEFDLVLPATVDVREVGMRDGLQLEAPVPLEGKLAMLEALVDRKSVV